MIVVAQLPVAKWLEGRRRMGAYAIEGVVWAAAWTLTGGFAALWLDRYLPEGIRRTPRPLVAEVAGGIPG